MTNDAHTDTNDLDVDGQIVPSASQMTAVEVPICNFPIDNYEPAIELKRCAEEENEMIIEEQEESIVRRKKSEEKKPALRKPHKTFEYRLACVRYYETHGLTLTQSASKLGLRSELRINSKNTAHQKS